MTNYNLKPFQLLILIHKITVYLLILKYIERIKGVTDSTGETALTFTYNGKYISRITDRDGRYMEYDVTEDGRLINVKGFGGEVYTYEYRTRKSVRS